MATGVGLVALAMLGAGSPAFAQTAQAPAPAAPAASPPSSSNIGAAAPAAQSALGDIVVTARRVNENLQKVPISIGVLTPATLNARQITGINDLKGSVAGLTTSRTTTPGNGYYTIRGITNTTLPTPAADNGIGFYIDGVYIARGEGSGVDIPDLARVEVDRGPQGTLFGRNSSAGAINFVTNVPTDRQELKYDVLYGNYNHLRASIIVNEPITDDLFVRVAYQHSQIDGDIRNTSKSPGVDYGQYGAFSPIGRLDGNNDESVSARVRYVGIEGLTVDYKFDYENDNEAAGANQLIGFVPSALAGTLGTLLPLTAPGAVQQSFKRLSSVNEEAQGPSPIRSLGHLLTLEYVGSDHFTLKNISAYRKLSARTYADLDGNDWSILGGAIPFTVSSNLNHLQQHQFSQEDQIIGKFGDLNVIAGGYYFNEKSRFISIYTAPGVITPQKPGVFVPCPDAFCTLFGQTAPGPFTLGENGRYNNSSYAGYLHADYTLDKFRLALGGRYTIDDRNTDDLRSFGDGPQHVSYRRFTYDAALNYQIDPSKLVYAKFATGYVSGGIIGNVPFKPEDDKQAELGFKTEWLDHKLRINGAVYYTWIKDRQSALPSVDQNNNDTLAAAGFSPPYPLGILVYNKPGTSTVRGFELETTLAPVRGVTLTANIGYNDPHNSDHGEVQAPKKTFAFSGEYDLPDFSNGSHVMFRLDGDYRSKYYATGGNFPSVFAVSADPVQQLPANLWAGYPSQQAYLDAVAKASVAGDYWQVNGRVALVDFPLGGAKATIAGFVQNILNDQSLLYSVNYGFSINGAFERPRTYGMELSVNF
jgi:iron complex outermembrane receptor protein